MSLLLAGTTDLLQLVTGQAASIDVHASWLDNLSGAITPSRTNTATINTAATTTIIGSPVANTQRNVKGVTIRNKHATASCDITVVLTDGTNANELHKVTLLAGESLHYFEGIGFSHYAVNGVLYTQPFNGSVGITGGTISGTDITTKAGTIAAAGFHMPTGVLKTAPVAGDVEYDGIVFYKAPVVNERGVITDEQFISIQGGTFTLTSQTAAQKLFNSPLNGAITLGGSRTYLFECQFDLSGMSSTSGSFGFALGGTATTTYLKWWSTGNKAALATAGTAQNTMNVNVAANTALVTATTNTVGWAFIQGIVRINAGGTFIPQVSLGVAAAAIVGRDSYLRLWPWGSNVITSVGNWS